MASSANLVELSTVRIPVLVTTGAEDVVTPPSNSTLMAASIPGASLRLYAASGHSFLFQSPDQVGADVLAFLKAAPASPPFSVTAATRCA